MTNTVKPGYKQTEVGVIPEDWEVHPLGEVVVFLDGRRRPVKDADRAKMRGTIPYYGASGIVDYVNNYLFDEDLILLGEDGENILSRNCRLAFRISGKAWVNNHAHVLKPNPDISIGFLTDFLESLNYEQYNSGTAQPKLNKQTCYRIPVALPPTLAEQEAIAGALSDADALIESLEQLVAKKRQIKHGTMQQLLTGQKRLPGFTTKPGYKQTEVGVIPEDWNLSTVGAEFTIQLGKMLDSDKNTGVSKPFLGNRAVQWGRFDLSDIGTIKLSPIDLQRFRLRHGDLLVCEGGEIGRAAIWDSSIEECYYQKALHRLRPKNRYEVRFLLGVLERLAATGYLLNFVTQTSIAHLPKDKFETVYIPLPPTQIEQQAIAAVLSDMDAEIAALEVKLSKARQVKQGMMQELLTGRIRLV